MFSYVLFFFFVYFLGLAQNVFVWIFLLKCSYMSDTHKHTFIDANSIIFYRKRFAIVTHEQFFKQGISMDIGAFSS